MKLTPQMLKQIVKEEMGKFGKMRDTKDAAKDTEEVEADGYADTLEKHVDMLKTLKVEESKLLKRLAQIREQKAMCAKMLAK